MQKHVGSVEEKDIPSELAVKNQFLRNLIDRHNRKPVHNLDVTSEDHEIIFFLLKVNAVGGIKDAIWVESQVYGRHIPM